MKLGGVGPASPKSDTGYEISPANSHIYRLRSHQ
jgi:hypothetical protein